MDVLSVEHEGGGRILRSMRGDVSDVNDSTVVHERYSNAPGRLPIILFGVRPLTSAMESLCQAQGTKKIFSRGFV